MSAPTAELPARMRSLPVDKHGRVVPYFVAWPDGQPDHRIADNARLRLARKHRLCSLCGQPLGSRFGTFVLGPMCTVTRTAPEPPNHQDCATYAVLVCPFLMRPDMRRRDSRLPEGHTDPAGIMIRRNPGVTALWTSRTYSIYPQGRGWLYDVGDPSGVAWYAEGRPATRDEVLASIDSGLPILRTEAAADRRADVALADLDRKHRAALGFLPLEVSGG